MNKKVYLPVTPAHPNTQDDVKDAIQNLGWYSSDYFEYLELLHISPKSNREGISENGLKVGKRPSGYGDSPEHEAVYLYHHNDPMVFRAMACTFGEFDIYQVKIRKEDFKFLLPDEDSDEKEWKESIERFGKLCITKDIPSKDVRLWITCQVHD